MSTPSSFPVTSGNELLHNLTSLGPVSLRVDMQSGNDSAYAHYANFAVDSEERQYSLSVSGYTGTAGEKKYFFLNMCCMYHIQYTVVVNINLIIPLNAHLVKNKQTADDYQQ